MIKRTGLTSMQTLARIWHPVSEQVFRRLKAS
jgi:hypothetical protein